jgi:hypothetical protein
MNCSIYGIWDLILAWVIWARVVNVKTWVGMGTSLSNSITRFTKSHVIANLFDYLRTSPLSLKLKGPHFRTLKRIKNGLNSLKSPFLKRERVFFYICPQS